MGAGGGEYRFFFFESEEGQSRVALSWGGGESDKGAGWGGGEVVPMIVLFVKRTLLLNCHWIDTGVPLYTFDAAEE